MELVLMHGGRRRRPRSRGFSLIEVLLAAVFVLIVAVGIVPLFVRSARSNLSGQDSTQAANFARSRVEQFMAIDFDNALMTVAGAGCSGDPDPCLQYDEYYRQGQYFTDPIRDAEWIAGTLADATAASHVALWYRRTRIKQYKFDDLTTALAAGSDPHDIDLKEIEVTIQSARTADNALGIGPTLSVRAWKAR